MSFASAFLALQNGHKVRRKHWYGFWVLEDNEIIMYCRDGRVINLRDSEDIMYTISNTACDDWLIDDDCFIG